ncbi:hypothetical protein C4J81_00045 [Deltaproteobacteria bacterium Smac51]|nr:hypothetical protein C4J81_00045 [Deltaproteobacteria bacterium Smac51]
MGRRGFSAWPFFKPQDLRKYADIYIRINRRRLMDSISNNLNMKIPSKIMSTIRGARNATSDRGMKLASIVIGIETKRTQEEATKAAEDYARGLMNGHKIDKVV